MEQIQTFFAAYSPIIMLIVMYLAFHFFLIRPQKAEKARREDMLNNLHKGNKIVTIGGLYGEILEIKDNIIDLKVADQVVLKMARSSVASNLSQGKSAKEEPAEKKTVEEQPTDNA
ncbi:MAG: preprotein translocase subunit YajC [Negativicutes bacterium]